MQKLFKIAFAVLMYTGFLLLTACSGTGIPAQTLPTIAISPTVIEIKSSPMPTQTMEDMIESVWVSDPELPQYDRYSTAYAKFPDVIKFMVANYSSNYAIASTLAVAISFPRPDSYLAAQGLITLGPDITGTTIPILAENLNSPLIDARIYSLILLGSTGPSASCAVETIAPRLWDPDPYVRTSAADALEKITEQDLIEREYEIVLTPAFLANEVAADAPEEKIVGAARKWWNEVGSKMDWHPGKGACAP